MCYTSGSADVLHEGTRTNSPGIASYYSRIQKLSSATRAGIELPFLGCRTDNLTASPSLSNFISPIITHVPVRVMERTNTRPPLVDFRGGSDDGDEKYPPHPSEPPCRIRETVSRLIRKRKREKMSSLPSFFHGRC